MLNLRGSSRPCKGRATELSCLGKQFGGFSGSSTSLLHDWRASLVAQLVKNLPAMQETWVRSPGWEDLLEKGMTILQYYCLENPMDRGAW